MTAAERTGIINRTSILGIVVNVLIAGVKIAAGLLASSIAIVSEGVNNAADALTSVLTMVGTRRIRRTILEYVRAHEHVKSFHAVYLEPGTNRLYCDLVVDYELADWEALRADFLDYMQAKVPGRDVVLTVETEFV